MSGGLPAGEEESEREFEGLSSPGMMMHRDWVTSVRRPDWVSAGGVHTFCLSAWPIAPLTLCVKSEGLGGQAGFWILDRMVTFPGIES